MHKIFVYGTLMRGESNHRLMASARLVGTASTKPEYALVNLGPFPAMVNGGDGMVTGELYEVSNKTLAELDRLEGHPRMYRRTPIELADGLKAETYIWACGNQLDLDMIIPTGSWRTRHQRRAP